MAKRDDDDDKKKTQPADRADEPAGASIHDNPHPEAHEQKDGGLSAPAQTPPQPHPDHPDTDPMGAQPTAQTDRQAMAVDAEQPPKLAFPVVGIGASAGGLEAMTEFISAMSPDSGMAFVFVQHLPPEHESMIAEILSKKTEMLVQQVEEGMEVRPNHVYVIRPGHVMTIKDGRLHLGEQLGRRAAGRPIDDFFKSLAEEQRQRAISIILSGMGSNGSAGAQAIKAVGGLSIAQDPESAQFPSMPRHLIDQGYADYILRPGDMPDVLLQYAGHPYTKESPKEAAQQLKRVENHVREVLAILRTRTRTDFNGYKKPTLLRRIQRRMGLTRLTEIADYAKLLRQSPSEVRSLADDLLIHVTGFFRDPESWDALRKRVIVPLIARREPESEIRAWVTACSSGEEAYSLAMVLVEEAERQDKPVGIKVFATDMAERPLAHARAGVYPGGIESEIDPERLERYFDREDGVYRVKQFLRECVVFAPQNVLSDPPFSRLDIVSCRNLLIYLEPDVQHRVLNLLHFGLREGGALFLGSSETIGGAEEMYELIDKRARIYRRVGPTRHGQLDFPLPHAVRGGGAGAAAAAVAAVESLTAAQVADATRLPPDRRHGAGRPSIAIITQRALLDQHIKAAVTVDRDYRVLYFHGNTRPFLDQPQGEPTRDLMMLARDGLRGSVRLAVHRCAAEQRAITLLDGWLEVSEGRQGRVAVTASPISPDDPMHPEYFVVSFEQLDDYRGPGPSGDGNGDGNVAAGETEAELRRTRDELQTTIEELQTSNEELKASHEEVTSINEELQSSNEELETSKEEMQSLNEELTTVNAQLTAKMEELQNASNDLSALLHSTSVAVVFLDPQLRIRKYTPAVRDLMELISSDVGRPLSDLHRKFDDPHLEDDARTVLERLTPIERSVIAENGRTYDRRVLPYRTADNRIDGVVVTFVDVTPRVQAESELRSRELWLRGQRAAMEAALNGAPLARSLAALVHTVTDALGEGTRAAFYLANAEGTKLYHLVGMPDEYARAVDGFEIGANSLACGPATHSGKPVITADVMQDPSWVSCRDMARRFDYRGCWSFPVMTAGGKFVGTFAVYSRLPREATQRDLDLVTLLTHTASIIIAQQTESEARRRAEEALQQFEQESMSGIREDEQRLRSLLENVTDFAIFTADATGYITSWNPGAQNTFGYAREEIIGHNARELFTPEDRAKGEPDKELATAAREGRASDDRWQLKKGGERFWASGVTTGVRDTAGNVSGFVKICRDDTDRKRLEEQLRTSNEALEHRVSERTGQMQGHQRQLRSLVAELGRAEIRERQRLATELHDNLAQSLAVCKMRVSAIEAAAAKDAKLKAEAAGVRDALGEAIGYTRTLMTDLRPDVLDAHDLTAAVEWIAKRMARHGLKVEVFDDGRPKPLHAEVLGFFFQAVRELLWNVVKHARTADATVRLERPDGEVRVIVEDTGVGFNASKRATLPTEQGGYGLFSIAERIDLLGGRLEIDSARNKGTRVTLIAPITRSDG